MTPEKRLLFCVPEITHSEIATYEVEGLKKSGFYITTSLYGGEGCKNFLMRLFVIFKNAYAIRRIAGKEKIDLVYLNTAFNLTGLLRDFITLFIIRSIRAKIFLKTHGSDSPTLFSKNLILKWIIRKYSLWADGFGVLSTEEKLNFIRVGFDAEKVFVIKNIINPEVYQKNTPFYQEHSKENIPILLFVARLIPAKGLIDTLLAAIILKEKGYSFKLIILGDGPDKTKAENLVNGSLIASSVDFAGFVPEGDTKVYYANSDLLVFPTYHEEGFPMAVFQSVGAGIAIITTKIRASADYLTEPENCLFVEPKNPEMLAQKTAYLLDNPDLLKSMSQNNRKLAALFSQETVCRELEQIFLKLLS